MCEMQKLNSDSYKGQKKIMAVKQELAIKGNNDANQY